MKKILTLVLLLTLLPTASAAIKFNGSTQGAYDSSDSFLTVASPITVECWVNYTNPVGSTHFFSENVTADSGFAFVGGISGGSLWRLSVGVGGTNGSVGPTANTWYYIHIDSNGATNNNMIIYNTDGSVADTVSDGDLASGVVSSYSFGYNKGNGPGNFITGKMRNCIIYNSVLTKGQTLQNLFSTNPLVNGFGNPKFFFPLSDGNDTRDRITGSLLNMVAVPTWGTDLPNQPAF